MHCKEPLSIVATLVMVDRQLPELREAAPVALWSGWDPSPLYRRRLPSTSDLISFLLIFLAWLRYVTTSVSLHSSSAFTLVVLATRHQLKKNLHLKIFGIFYKNSLYAKVLFDLIS